MMKHQIRKYSIISLVFAIILSLLFVSVLFWKEYIESGILVVFRTPTNATVKILNKLEPSEERRYEDTSKLRPGRYHVEVSKLGYKTKKMWVKLDAGETKTVAVSLDELQRDGIFVLCANGIVKDTNTGLEWKAAPNGTWSLDDAEDWVRSLDSGAGPRWRMPTRDELEDLKRGGAGFLTPLLKTTAGTCVWCSYNRYYNRAVCFEGASYFHQKHPHSSPDRAFAVRSRSGGGHDCARREGVYGTRESEFFDPTKGTIPFSKKQIPCPFCNWSIPEDVFLCPNCGLCVPKIYEGVNDFGLALGIYGLLGRSEGTSQVCHFFDERGKLIRIHGDYGQYNRFIYAIDGRLSKIESWKEPLKSKEGHIFTNSKEFIFDEKGHLIEDGLIYEDDKIFERHGTRYKYSGEKIIERKFVSSSKKNECVKSYLYQWIPDHGRPYVGKTVYRYDRNGRIKRIVYTGHAPPCKDGFDNKTVSDKSYIRVDRFVTDFHYKDDQLIQAELKNIVHGEFCGSDEKDIRGSVVHFQPTEECTNIPISPDLPPKTNILIFNASDSRTAHKTLQKYLEKQFPHARIDSKYDWLARYEMKTSQIFFIKDRFRAEAVHLENWLPGKQHVINYKNQPSRQDPDFRNRKINLHLRDIVIFFGNDYRVFTDQGKIGNYR